MICVSHIEAPKEISLLAGDYGSHRQLVWLILMNTTGSVCEVGCGLYSTEMIDDICAKDNRNFKSYESDAEWSGKAPVKYGERIVVDYDELELDADVLFVDCAPGEKRKEIIEKFKDRCKIIIAHDTEPGAEYVYGMTPILNSFKYRLEYRPDSRPHTTAVSNIIDITQWI